MGTGSVETRFCGGGPACRRCLSPFSGGLRQTPLKKGGQAPRRPPLLAGPGEFALGASPPFFNSPLTVWVAITRRGVIQMALRDPGAAPNSRPGALIIGISRTDIRSG